MNDKLKSWIFFEKHEIDYNLLLSLRVEWELELDLLHCKWILTQDKIEAISMESRRQLERKKQINENRMKGYEYQMNLESSQMDFEWLIKLAEEIQDEVVVVKEEITTELEEEICCILMLELLMEMEF